MRRLPSVILLAFLPGPAAAAPQPLDAMPLAWKPTVQAAAAGERLAAPIEVAPLADGRSRPTVVGQNEENRDDGLVLRVVTRDDGAGWVAEQVRRQLAPHLPPGEAALRLEGRLERLFVLETDRYRGEAVLDLVLRDAGGRALWQGTVRGASDHFGRSYRDVNYQESLSNSLLNAVDALVADPGFRAAVASAAGR